MKNSVLRQQFLAFVGFGLVMGLIFPLFASLFVEWKDGMRGWFVVSCLVAGVTIGLVNFYLVKVLLLPKIAEVADVAKAVGQNDLTRTCRVESQDVIGKITTSVNNMVIKLRDIVQQLQDMSCALNDETSTLAQVSGNARNRVIEQQKLTDAVMQLLDNTVARLNDIAGSANEAVTLANEADQHAHSSLKSIEVSLKRTTELTNNVEAASDAMQTLAQQTENIGLVLDVIRGIADQTNLLALNAAIEAARAGETGRGFAVVADEVRTLANRTQQSTTEIQQIIGELQQGSGTVLQLMKVSRDNASSTLAEAKNVANTLQTVSQATHQIKLSNDRITISTQEQVKMTGEANRQLRALNELTGTAAQGVTRLAQAMDSLSNASASMDKLIGQFRR
ncbi:methyl-accepting chemotaxis protein [Bowmanella sp. JS7-9]|uniref:Methyl-accepting chemotaxis protein n=2 Tax=Pseudobowmanella zhangzhouensis TaxID=1537679 RepID=A0ABW1XNZ7_9ALTE|nr:methyl-accepting chemotaxis protein [Bowmanella sp. JS7-9]TBX23700.1 hypothetical protein TK45_06250 [Bowmanella sp. JS7-9]